MLTLHRGGGMTMNDRLREAGIKTIRAEDGVLLSRNGIAVPRPHVDNCPDLCLVAFNVVIGGSPEHDAPALAAPAVEG